MNFFLSPSFCCCSSFSIFISSFFLLSALSTSSGLRIFAPVHPISTKTFSSSKFFSIFITSPPGPSRLVRGNSSLGATTSKTCSGLVTNDSSFWAASISSSIGDVLSAFRCLAFFLVHYSLRDYPFGRLCCPGGFQRKCRWCQFRWLYLLLFLE